jgi:hypothetical protein
MTRSGTRTQLPYHVLDLCQRERLVGSHELLQVHPAVFEDNVESLDQRRRVRARRSEGVAQVDNVPMLHQEGVGARIQLCAYGEPPDESGRAQ